MSCEFTNAFFEDEKKSSHSITCSNEAMLEVGLGVFDTESAYEAFKKMVPIDAFIKVLPTGSTLQDIKDFAIKSKDNKYDALNGGAGDITTGKSIFQPEVQFIDGVPSGAPSFMYFDQALKVYKLAHFDPADPIFGNVYDFASQSGKALHPDFRHTYIDFAALLADAHIKGHLEPNPSNQDKQEELNKNESKAFIKFVQTSLSGCLSWAQPLNFIYGAKAALSSSGTVNDVCPISGDLKFEMRFYDHETPRKNKRKIVASSPPNFAMVPTHPWGTAYAGNEEDLAEIGAYPPIKPGGADNPKNNVSTELDVYYNPNTGKAEAGTRQILARVIDPIPRVKIPDMPLNPDTLSPTDQYTDANRMNYWSSGYAMPVSVHKGNPYAFGPTFSNRGRSKECEDNKKEKLLVINRSQRSYPAGRLVLLQRIDNEWIPIDFGDDPEDLVLGIGTWDFQYLIANRDTFFKDDRFFYEETYNPELGGAITPSKYESLFKSSFYDDITLVAKRHYGSSAGPSRFWIDEANLLDIILENRTVTEACPANNTPGSSTVDGTVSAPILDALNGGYVEKALTPVAIPGCDDRDPDCTSLDALQGALGNYQALESFFNGVGAGGDGYDGWWTLSSAPSNTNTGTRKYPDCIYTRTTPKAVPFSTGGQTYNPFAAGECDCPTGSIIPFDPSKLNFHHQTLGCGNVQRQTDYDNFCGNACGDGGIAGFFCAPSVRQVCTLATGDASYIVNFGAAMYAEKKGICDAQFASSPKIRQYQWVKATVGENFVGSRRYYNVTSFDMLHASWNGVNEFNFLGRCNPHYDKTGGKIENPADTPWRELQPFWGAVFTEGYKEEAAESFITRMTSSSIKSVVCSNVHTSVLKATFGNEYMSDGGGAGGAAGPSKGILESLGGTLDLRYTWDNGDKGLHHLPADVGANASPSGLHGTPIKDFRRMVALTNVEMAGDYDPSRDKEEPTTAEAKETWDWGRSATTLTDPLSSRVATYFATKSYNIGGFKATIPDRYAWAYTLNTGATLPDTDDNGNSLVNKNVNRFCMDSTFDIEPADKSKITFVPLSAEWIGAFDAFDPLYAMYGSRAGTSSFNSTSKDGMGALGEIGGWFSDNGKGGITYPATGGNPTNDRLSEEPANSIYTSDVNSDLGSYADPGGTGPFYPPKPVYAADAGGFGGQRGDSRFKIGRNHYFIVSIDFTQYYGTNAAGEETTVPTNAPNFDYEFVEPEDFGVELLKDPNAQGFSHGVLGNFTPQRMHGFPFDGYVRHRTEAGDGVIVPRNFWTQDTSADCVGIITGKTTIRTTKTDVICTCNSTLGVEAKAGEEGVDPVGQWGGSDNSISCFGNTHVYARAFEAWPEQQTLFDSRYFAVMHFNHGVLFSPPKIQEISVEGVEYYAHVLDSSSDYKVPTIFEDTNTDAYIWDEVPDAAIIYGDSDEDGKAQAGGLPGPIANTDLWKVCTIRRGMLLPFTHQRKTIQLSESHLVFVNDVAGDPATGKDFLVGDTLSFTGGTGTGGQIEVTAIGPIGEITGFKMVEAGEDYQTSDFMNHDWSNDQQTTGYILPVVTAIPDGNSNGKGAVISCVAGKMGFKRYTDDAPASSQSAPVKCTLAGPASVSEGQGRFENRTSNGVVSLAGADGKKAGSYDIFVHFHNDITSAISSNKYKSPIGYGLIQGKCQYVDLTITPR